MEERPQYRTYFYHKLMPHLHHKIGFGVWGNLKDPDDICIICEDCGETLLSDYDFDFDYDNSDIIKREPSDRVDVQKVRDKAFGDKKEEVKPAITEYEESETVTISKPSEKIEKVKTIDELLEDTSDVVVDLSNEEVLEEKPYNTKEDLKTDNKSNVEDTLENDLFDLIDSMYDSKEDGE